jgi:hypothetical protein
MGSSHEVFRVAASLKPVEVVVERTNSKEESDSRRVWMSFIAIFTSPTLTA